MNKTQAFLVLGISLLSTAGSQLVLKSRLSPLSDAYRSGAPWTAILVRAASDAHIWAGAGLVVIGAACWYLALTRLPISLMLPVSAVIGPIASAGAYFFLGEHLTPEKIGAIALILAGATWLGWLNA